MQYRLNYHDVCELFTIYYLNFGEGVELANQKLINIP